jgi:hypothetical protein
VSWPEDASTANIVVMLQKLAKNASHLKPGPRSVLLLEAAKRLNAYRQAERLREQAGNG